MKSAQFATGYLTIFILLSIATQTSHAEPMKLLWGDTHLHTSYSFDAFLNQNKSADPDTAYRWAKGLPVIHPYNRTRIQIETPLDFLVVADHAELMGVIRAVNTDTAELEDLGFIDNLIRRFKINALSDAIDSETGSKIFVDLLPKKAQNPGGDPVADPANEMVGTNTFGDTTKIITTAWHEIIDAAERHNQPGKFTSLIGWEWSSIPTGANLHRVIFTPDGAKKAKQFLPYGSDQSQYPEDLWSWLEETQTQTGTRFIAIPHNSNISKGYMFAQTNLKGQAITADYARRRINWEPVAEITQIKGDSETHPALSPEDEFADFETYPFYIQQKPQPYQPQAADYIRSSLITGLGIEQKTGANPYKFGLIGSTDAHTGLASAEEVNFWGKMARDSIPENKQSVFTEEDPDRVNGWDMAASGLAAIWAKENTREEIYAAFKRKEVYATSGPRIKVQLFASWNFEEMDAQANDFANIGYAKGVPMGGDLVKPKDSSLAPKLLIRAVKDPNGANLDRVQVIKGWIDKDHQQHEKVFNVAWSGQRNINSAGKLPVVGNTVNLEAATYTNTIGSPELATVWQDPEFNLQQRAFYYVRVLQIPTPRHSLYDKIALQNQQSVTNSDVIQERAYTSPIWYTP